MQGVASRGALILFPRPLVEAIGRHGLVAVGGHTRGCEPPWVRSAGFVCGGGLLGLIARGGYEEGYSVMKRRCVIACLSL